MDKKELKQLDKDLVKSLNDEKLLAFEINEVSKIENEIRQLQDRKKEKEKLIGKFTCGAKFVDLEDITKKHAAIYCNTMYGVYTYNDLQAINRSWKDATVRNNRELAFQLDKDGRLLKVINADSAGYKELISNERITAFNLYGVDFFIETHSGEISKETVEAVEQKTKAYLESIELRSDYLEAY